MKQVHQFSTRTLFIFTVCLFTAAFILQAYVGIRTEKRIARAVKAASKVEKGNELIDSFKSEGFVHKVFEAQEVYAKEVKLKPSISPAYVDSLARALKISTDNFKEVTKVNYTLEGKVKAMRVETDSLKKKTYYFQQKYLTAKFSEVDSSLTYKYAGELGSATYTKRSGFLGLGKIKRQVDIFSKDPDMTINGVSQMSIKEDVRRKPFGLGVQVGYFLNPVTGLLERGLGVGLSYSIVRF